jgi:2',3'-cyclic-nucleotide 2'-phosphodiesterase
VEPFRVLFVGDVVAAVGLRALCAFLPKLAKETRADAVVVNGENAAGGYGITVPVARQMLAHGVHVITTGNHVWDKKEIIDRIEDFPHLLRPANYPPGVPGRGWCVLQTPRGNLGVVNLAGRVFMEPLDCPFRAADQALRELAGRAPVILVDFHAEATSEKRALGFYLDGRVTAVVGTHTHVPTADAQILPGGTGYITDVGMTGAAESVIGISKPRALERFLTQVPRSPAAAEGSPMLCGALVTAEPGGKCTTIERVEVR